jgi:GxxExxY protein
MNADEHGSDQKEMNELTEKVIRCAFTVSNTLGCGFLEKVYENALAHEFRKAGLKTDQQHGITIHYDGVVVGEYAADLLVGGPSGRSSRRSRNSMTSTWPNAWNYLRATNLRLCL